MESDLYKNLSMAKKLGLYKQECDFYCLLPTEALIRSPKSYYADFDCETHRSVLVSKDFHTQHTAD